MSGAVFLATNQLVVVVTKGKGSFSGGGLRHDCEALCRVSKYCVRVLKCWGAAYAVLLFSCGAAC